MQTLGVPFWGTQPSGPLCLMPALGCLEKPALSPCHTLLVGQPVKVSLPALSADGIMVHAGTHRLSLGSGWHRGQGWSQWMYPNDGDVNKNVITSVMPSPRAALVPVFYPVLLFPPTSWSPSDASCCSKCLRNASSLSYDFMYSFLSPTFILDLTLVFPVIPAELFLYICQSWFLSLALNKSCFKAE